VSKTPWTDRALNGRLGHCARPEGRDELVTVAVSLSLCFKPVAVDNRETPVESEFMVFAKVQPANREGAWEVDGFHHRTEAKLALRRCEELRVRLNEELDRHERERKSGAVPRRIPNDLTDEYRFLRTATVVFAAMAVEGFLNYYGVKRLGEDFYSANFERLSLAQKVSALLATCAAQLLSNDAELIAVTKRLAEARNALVHPKSREARRASGGPLPLAAQADLPHESVENMERFFTLFGEVDPQAIGMMPWSE